MSTRMDSNEYLPFLTRRMNFTVDSNAEDNALRTSPRA
jgi:hypothetical protein